jgi:hypothetical protein
MSIIEQAKNELNAINFGDEDTAVMIGLLEQFFDQWDSGGAVSVAAPVLMRLINGQPLKPLTGEDSEWHDPMGDGSMFQNIRCSSVFKCPEPTGRGRGGMHPYDIDNEAWDGRFPYDPTSKLPSSPVIEVVSLSPHDTPGGQSS